MTSVLSRPTLACSTGAITRGPDATDHQRLIQWCPHIDADALEVMIYDDWYPRIQEITRHIQSLGKPIVAVHAEKSIGPNLVANERSLRESALRDLAMNSRFARQVGANVVVLHLWGLPDGDAKLDDQLAVLPDLVTVALDEGVELGIEAIPCTTKTPLRNLERVLDRDSRARFVLDTEFLAMHDELYPALEAGWLWADNRVMHLHIKDYDGQIVDAKGNRRYLHPSEGDIDFDDWFRQVAGLGFNNSVALEATVVESDGTIDLARLNASLGRLRTTLQRAWSVH